MSPNDSALLNLPLSRAAYSDRTAWFMARCSQLAYVHFEAGEEQQLRDSLQELGLQFVCGFNRESTRAFLASNPRFAVLAFRGTEENMQNILTDIDVRFRHDKSGARIANGFGAAYTLVQKEIADAVDKLDPALPLYITGHSLGGALAVIAAIRIRPSDRIAACYTYGCPRVGNAEFTSELWKVPVYRQVHSSDIVPRVPFAFGYRQAGDLRYIKRSGALVEDPNSIGPFLSFLFSLLGLVIGRKTVFLNHRIAGYVDSLEAWALRRLTKDGHPQTPPKTLSASGGGVAH
jgi:hypothetical protein